MTHNVVEKKVESNMFVKLVRLVKKVNNLIIEFKNKWEYYYFSSLLTATCNTHSILITDFKNFCICFIFFINQFKKIDYLI